MTFAFTYLRRELTRRFARTLVTALGLAAGVSLVIGIVGVSAGLNDAQDQVLSPLHSVGTDILVTRVVGATSSGSTSTTTQQNSFFAGQSSGLNQSDVSALLSDNSSLITDLSKLGKPGSKFTRDFFLPATLLTFPGEAVPSIAKIPHVTRAAGALSLLATHQTGTVPQIVATLQTESKTITQTNKPTPMTQTEIQAFQVCLQASGGGFGGGKGKGGATKPSSSITSCLPERFRQYVQSITIPAETIQQVINPPKTDIASTNYTVGGVDPGSPDTGLITQSQITKGSFFDGKNANELVLNVAYANKQKLDVGANVVINGTTFKVIGLADPTLSGNTDDEYMPLAALQSLATKQDRVNTVLVKVDDSSNVDAVAAAIRQQLPGAQVVTTKTLADQVTGSLDDAKGLVDRLGGALTAIVLAGAFLIAILLTLSGVAKRVREIGTLRAIGWRRARVVRQIVLETFVIGMLGGLLGVAGGLAVDAAVAHYSPALTVGNVSTLGQGSSQFDSYLGDVAQESKDAEQQARATHEVRIVPPLQFNVLALGVGFALLGGLLAGAVGGWRASRLQPADALRDVG